MNRKECYYTATVLPAIICADNFRHFSKFMRLLNIDASQIYTPDGELSIQFFTEYSLADAIFSSITRERFHNFSPLGDTPDLIILIPGNSEPTMIVIEGKMFMGLTRGNLAEQMENQNKNIIAPLNKMWPELKIIHVSILPEALLHEFGTLQPRSLTWESILKEFRDVSSAQYFLDVLATALEDFPELRALPVFDANADAKMSGQNIANGFGDTRFPFQIMGRAQGMTGQKLLEDINSGRWKTQAYQVSKADVPLNTNWFQIAEFVKLVGDL